MDDFVWSTTSSSATVLFKGNLARLLDGVNVADVGVLLALVWLVVRLEWTRSENATAHAGIAKNIGDVKQDLTREVDEIKRDVKMLLTGDVAWMQAVLRDRTPTRSVSGRPTSTSYAS